MSPFKLLIRGSYFLYEFRVFLFPMNNIHCKSNRIYSRKIDSPLFACYYESILFHSIGRWSLAFKSFRYYMDLWYSLKASFYSTPSSNSEKQTHLEYLTFKVALYTHSLFQLSKEDHKTFTYQISSDDCDTIVF